MTEQLDAFVGAAESAGILLDVDGTLSQLPRGDDGT